MPSGFCQSAGLLAETPRPFSDGVRKKFLSLSGSGRTSPFGTDCCSIVRRANERTWSCSADSLPIWLSTPWRQGSATRSGRFRPTDIEFTVGENLAHLARLHDSLI